MEQLDDDDDDDFTFTDLPACEPPPTSRKRPPPKQPKPPKPPKPPKESVRSLKLHRGTKSTRPTPNAVTNQVLPTQEPLDPSHGLGVEWEVGQRWDAHAQYECERTTQVDAVLKACDDISHANSVDDAKRLAQAITKLTMANHDRTTVELNSMRQIVREELVDSRLRAIQLIHETRNEQHHGDNQGALLSRAMASVLQVQSSLRGIYPHISYAQAHLMDDPALSKA